jgi:hypothetical protein
MCVTIAGARHHGFSAIWPFWPDFQVRHHFQDRVALATEVMLHTICMRVAGPITLFLVRLELETTGQRVTIQKVLSL